MEEKKINDGGSAFPGFEHFTDGKKLITGQPHGGLTKREWFAGMAMVGLLSSWNSTVDVEFPDPKHSSFHAFKYADAMLAEGEKK